MKRLGLLLTVAVVFALLISGACSKKKTIELGEGKITIEEGKEVKIQTDEGTVTITGDEEEGEYEIKTKEGKKYKLSY